MPFVALRVIPPILNCPFCDKPPVVEDLHRVADRRAPHLGNSHRIYCPEGHIKTKSYWLSKAVSRWNSNVNAQINAIKRQEKFRGKNV